MTENKEKLHALIDSITNAGTAAYLERSSGCFWKSGENVQNKNRTLKIS